MASQLEWKRIVAAAYFYVVERRRLLSRVLAAPFLALVVIAAIVGLIAHPYASLIAYPAVLAAETLLAISVHRLILLGDHSIPRWGWHTFSGREVKFAAYIVVVTTVASLSLLLGVIPLIGPIAAILGFIWICSRLALVFPGMAIDREISFEAAWHLSGHHQAPLMACLAAFPVVLGVPALLVVAILVVPLALAGVSVGGAAISGALLSAAITIVMVFTVASLSIAFREVIRVEAGT